MPTAKRPWDDRWTRYPATSPIRPAAGIATSRQRGDMAVSWWSGRLVELLGSYGLGARMARGRRYARRGQLVSFDVQRGLLVAQVQGSRHVPYVVTVAMAPLTTGQWAQVDAAMAGRAAIVAQLLAGEVPPELEAVFADAGVALLPARWADLSASCSCPDWENPCKHIAAVLYVFADRLEREPWLLVRWRGRHREEVLDALRPPATAPREGLAPWWPLVPGAPRPAGDATDSPQWAGLTAPEATLARLGPLDIVVRGQPVPTWLLAAYRALAEEA